MALLDFKEISPPVKLAAGHGQDNLAANLDDFEKFAQDFFKTFYSAKIKHAVARGADKGRDLVVEVEVAGVIENWLVSCKHTTFGGKAVNSDDEKNILNRFDRLKGPRRFIGFYSHIASVDLRDTLEDLQKNNKRFNFRIFNNIDIERKLLSANNGTGWFFACRHFPKSFSRLFSRFLMPIEHYKEHDVKERPKGRLSLSGPGGGVTPFDGSAQKREEKSRELVIAGNEAITSAVHEVMFAHTLLDITKRWPACFRWWSLDDPAKIRVGTIVPSYDVDCLVDLMKKDGHSSGRLVANLWFWWNQDKAAEVFSQAWKATGRDTDPIKTMKLLNPLYTESICDIEERDLLTRFVAFAQGGRSGKCEWDEVVSVAEHHGLTSKVNQFIESVLTSLEPVDREKVCAASNAAAKLREIGYYLDSQDVRKELSRIDSRLSEKHYQSFQGLVENGTEWKIAAGANFDWFSDRVLG